MILAEYHPKTSGVQFTSEDGLFQLVLRDHQNFDLDLRPYASNHPFEFHDTPELRQLLIEASLHRSYHRP